MNLFSQNTENIETLELRRFCTNLSNDVNSIFLEMEEGGTKEQVFTSLACDYLRNSGEIENFIPSYDEKNPSSKGHHKINGYSISENFETIDAFITVYNNFETPTKISKEEIDSAHRKITSFLNKAIYRDYYKEVEESSEIFDFAITVATSLEIKENLTRINLFIITDGIYGGKEPSVTKMNGVNANTRVIDLEILFKLHVNSRLPIEIDFFDDQFKIPCIKAPHNSENYESYLAIFPGQALASIYERFGSRLLEQNVRSFLEFKGKINKGIRNTILKEPNMFLAFNNGISATAKSVELSHYPGEDIIMIKKVDDFQIVNGGQTTASIYHTWKKDKANISQISVQVKLNVVKDEKEFSKIVSRIAEYANTQNRISISDLSSNSPFHIEIEKLSRNIWTPHLTEIGSQTRWFYERARGQYRNERNREGFTTAKAKAFDRKNPRKQIFTKEDLAKYSNTYQEILKGTKAIVGPHYVVRGGQKNYAQFIAFNQPKPKDITQSYYEDLIAKAILFKACEKIYGIKPNAIGDLRYITVPYTIAILGYHTDYKLDLYAIWKSQSLQAEMESYLKVLMIEVEEKIKASAPGALYGEWAKKEECWEGLKKAEFRFQFDALSPYLASENNPITRRHTNQFDIDEGEKERQESLLREIPPLLWHSIVEWGKKAGTLSQAQVITGLNIKMKIPKKEPFTLSELKQGEEIFQIAYEQVPELFEEMGDFEVIESKELPDSTFELTMDLISKAVYWEKHKKRIKPHEYLYLKHISEGKTKLDSKSEKIAGNYIQRLISKGFNPEE